MIMMATKMRRAGRIGEGGQSSFRLILGSAQRSSLGLSCAQHRGVV